MPVPDAVETVAQRTSTAPFGVRDASGTVLVDPAGARFGHAELVVDRFQNRPYGPRGSLGVFLFGMDIELASADDTLNDEYKEWVVRAGQRV